MKTRCLKCQVRSLKKEKKQLRAAVTALFRACEVVAIDLGTAEWATDLHGAELLREIIDRRHGQLTSAMAQATRKEAGP